MKKLITILPILLSILYGCSSKEEKKKKVSKEPITRKQEIVKEEAPPEVNYKTLRSLIDGGRLIPLDFFEGNDIFSLDSSFSARIYLLEESDAIIIGEVYVFKKTNRSSYSTFIGAFSKEDGMLKSYLVSKGKESGDDVKNKRFLGFTKKDNLIKFAMLEPVIIDSLKEVTNELNNRKILFEVSGNGEILATDTLEYFQVDKFKEFIEKFKNNKELSEYQEEAYYSKFAEISVQQVNYFETIFSSDDILVFRVRWSISDQTLESIWVYTVYGEFKSSCEAIYPFEDYGIKIKKEKFEVVDRKKRKVSINMNWEQYELIADDEAGFYFGDKYVGNGEWNLFIFDDFTCELIEENVEKTKVDFLDFIGKLNTFKDVSDYKNEPYYQDFNKIEFGRAMIEILPGTENIQIYRIKSETVEARVGDEIWIYTNSGERKSVCKGPYPPDAFDISINDFSFKKTSDNPLQFDISADWNEYEIVVTEEGYPDKGDLLLSKQSNWVMRVDDNFQCSFEEVEIAH